MESMVLVYNRDILQAMDGTPPRAVTTTGDRDLTSVVTASIAESKVYVGGGTRGVVLG